jgi:hypothetical protein
MRIAASTVNSVLKHYSLISPGASAAATAWRRFKHQAPNALWQDFLPRTEPEKPSTRLSTLSM